MSKTLGGMLKEYQTCMIHCNMGMTHLGQTQSAITRSDRRPFTNTDRTVKSETGREL